MCLTSPFAPTPPQRTGYICLLEQFSFCIEQATQGNLMSEHIVEKKIYYVVFGTLMILLAATVGIAYIHLGELNVIAALTIAFIKATLIILYFMHVRYSSRVLWIFVGAGFFWLGILFALAFSDFLTRGWLPQPTGWE
jgi:cytochrome c oxidase subunit 4